MSLGYVYVRLGNDYSDYLGFNNFDSLIEAVAYSAQYKGGMQLIKTVGNTQTVCAGKTKKYIAAEATRFIGNIQRDDQGIHMSLLVSKKQLDRLIKVCKHKDYRMSCYSLVLLHIIYVNIKKSERSNFCVDLNSLAQLIYNLANQYLEHNPCDLAEYIVNCYKPVDKEINKGEICHSQDFPNIHRQF